MLFMESSDVCTKMYPDSLIKICNQTERYMVCQRNADLAVKMSVWVS